MIILDFVVCQLSNYIVLVDIYYILQSLLQLHILEIVEKVMDGQ